MPILFLSVSKPKNPKTKKTVKATPTLIQQVCALYERAGKFAPHPSRYNGAEGHIRLRRDLQEALDLKSRVIIGTPQERLALVRQLHPSLRQDRRAWGVQLRPPVRTVPLP